MTGVARTLWPSEGIAVEVPEELEFESALEVVAQGAVSRPGAARVSSRRPSTDTAWIQDELAAVHELARVLRRGVVFAPQPLPELEPVLERLSVAGSVLEAGELVKLREALAAMRLVAGSLKAISGEARRVASLLVRPPPTTLERAIDRALEPDGSVKDGASSELASARRALRSTRAQLISLLDGKARQLPESDRSGEGAVTVRGGRYVIAVRREARSRVKGIVHGESSSGVTVFIEPEESVELGNDLAAHEAAEARAVQAVLRDLTEACRSHLEAIERGWEMCVRADDLYARARYMLSVNAAVPDVHPAPAPLIIRQGVHPLLGASGDAPVPFDLTLDGGLIALVVSGPNAGGKTVLLKAVGLITAMAQSGVVPPVGGGSSLPVFGRLFVDIGDRQSIAESLSTFSAHLEALKAVLVKADQSSLVLLDELGGSTDPVEGAALAAAVLVRLTEVGCISIVTTHLSELKELAARTDRVENACLAFDEETLQPTYRLVQGKPGRSYALAIARRLGLPEDVLTRAAEFTPDEVRTLEETLAQLERREAELAEREASVARLDDELHEARNAVEAARAELAVRQQGLARRERELEKEGRERARRFLLEARRRVEEALALARAAVNEATAKEARRLVEEGVKTEAEALEKLKQAAREKGWTIRVGDVIRETGDALRQTDVSRLTSPVSRSPSHVSRASSPVALSEVTLRGMHADEARTALVAALDQAVVADIPSLRVIHGKGTGALRSLVREVLEADKRVTSFRLAPPEQGGSGVTIVEFGQ